LEKNYKNQRKMPRNKAFQEENALESAMQVFWTKGYNATSMEDLVAAMGINRASLYTTFGDKKQLFLNALWLYQNQSNRNVQAIMAQNAPSPKAKLTAIAQFLMEEALTQTTEPRGCLLANATSEMALLDPDICQFVTNNVLSFEQTFEQLIREGQSIGEFNASMEAAYGATFMTNFLYGIRTVSKTKHDATKMRQSLALALSVLG
jgi:TetR/AcrR family transcriptional regulator, transcriptional repressor for nem operon